MEKTGNNTRTRRKKGEREITEKQVRADIRKLLKQHDFLVIPYVPGFYGMKGCSDLLCCGTVDGWRGKFVAIEIKRPGGKASPEQIAFLHEVEKRGGVAILADSVTDVIQALHIPTLF